MARPFVSDSLMDRIGSRVLGRLRNDVCVVRKPVTTKDASGANVSTFADAASVSCRVRPALREVDTALTGGRLTPEADFVVYLPRTTPVGKGWRIVRPATAYRAEEVFAVTNDPHEPTIKFELAAAVKEVK